MKALLTYILGLLGLAPKKAETKNINNQPAITPLEMAEIETASVTHVISSTGSTIADKIQAATPKQLLGLLQLGAVEIPDMTVKLIHRHDGKPAKVAKLIAPRSGRLLSYRIVPNKNVGQTNECLLLQRLKHRKGPVFTRPLSMVE